MTIICKGLANALQCMNFTDEIRFSLSAPSPCENNIDCNNKGACVDGTCSCYNGWEGSRCLGMWFKKPSQFSHKFQKKLFTYRILLQE